MTHARLFICTDGQWHTNFIAIPLEFAERLRASCPSGVMALRLQWTGLVDAALVPCEAFVGWDGLISHGPYVHVPKHLAERCGVQSALDLAFEKGGAGLSVNVMAVRGNAVVSGRVEVEPETYEDWAVLERHAGVVEEQMLRQICVLGNRQRFVLWVANVPVKLVVVAGVEPNSCVRLANETEVVVAPKAKPAAQRQPAVAAGSPASTQQQPVATNGSSSLVQQQPMAANASRERGQGKSVALRVQDATAWGPGNGMAYVNHDTLVGLRNVARWNACGEDSLTDSQGKAVELENPIAPVFCVVGASEDAIGPVLTLVISDRVAPGHVALSRSARRGNVKLFSKCVLTPISSSQKLPMPPASGPCLLVLKSGGTGLNKDAFRLDALRSALESETSAICDGSWLAVGGDALYRVAIPANVRKHSFWLAEKNFRGAESWKFVDDEASSLPEADIIESNLSNTKTNEFKEDDTDDLHGGAAMASNGTIETYQDKSTNWHVAELGGPATQVANEMISERLSSVLARSVSDARVRLNAGLPGSAFLYGQRGCGKSTLINALGGTMSEDSDYLTFVMRLDCAKLKGGKRSAVQKRFESAFAEAEKRAPSMIVFDDLDILLPQPANAGEEDPQTVWLSEFLEGLIEKTRHRQEARELKGGKKNRGWKSAVALVATGKAKRSLRNSLLKPGYFEKSYEISSLDAAGRNSVLKALCKRMNFIYDATEDEIERVAALTEGYGPADLETVVLRAIHAKSAARENAEQNVEQNVQQNGEENTKEFLVKALKNYTPASLRGVKLAKSDTKWSDVGGLLSVREVLKETLELPFQFAALYDRSPQRLASGILLYGPPGCGKTLLAGAVASECGLNFISVKGPEVLNKYIGASEQAIRDLFARGASVAPCVIFFDEFDAIAPKRGNDSTGVTDRVVNQMLTFLDGVEVRKGVYVMAATSRPDLVDPALLRPGRLDKQVYCGFPDEKERLSILYAVSRKLTMTNEARNVALPRAAKEGLLFTGADLQALVATAQLLAVHDESTVVTAQHVESALADTRPSVGVEEHARFDRLYKQFRGDRVAFAIDDGSAFGEGHKMEKHQKVALM